MNKILTNIQYDLLYVNKIKHTKYSQKIHDQTIKYKNLEELIIYTYDVESILEKQNELYINNKKIQLASELSDNQIKYKTFNYSKCLKKSEIQTGLQKKNTLTTILYLSDIYNISIIIYYHDKYYILSKKKRTILFVEYDSLWKIVEKKNIIVKGELCELHDIIDLNINTIDIYNKYLNSINNYKIAELIEISKENKIPIEKDGKRKRKQELYDEINELKM